MSNEFEASPPEAPWRRNPDDTKASWRAFKHYTLAGPERSLERTAEALGHASSRHCKEWSRTKDWQRRVEAYDHWLLDRGEHDKKQAEAIRKHGEVLDKVYEDVLKCGQVLLKLSISGLQQLQQRIIEDKEGTQPLRLGELNSSITTALKSIDIASATRSRLLGIDAFEEIIRNQ